MTDRYPNSWNLPDLLRPGNSAAPRALHDYFVARRDEGRYPKYTGAMFERLGGGGDRPAIANFFTAEDIVAVSMLSVDVPAPVTLRLLGADAPRLSRLLQAIPTDLELVDAAEEDINEQSAAWQLWDRLVKYDGVGGVTASKLLARKRPRLLPVFDSVVERVLHAEGRTFWADLRNHLREENRFYYDGYCRARAEADLGDDISVIRIFDVLVWLTGEGNRYD